MADPLSLALLSSVTLTEGIKFLYDRAGGILDRARERRAARRSEALELEAAQDPVLGSQLAAASVESAVVERNAAALEGLRTVLTPYVHGELAADPRDAALRDQVEALRGLLELLYGQRIAFRGESRGKTGSTIDVEAVAREVEGRLTAVRAKKLSGGAKLRVRTDTDHVGSGAEVIGVDLDDIQG
ncbi:hypothetical protein [Kitasatospora sp. NPDC048407]|uniref:hypothetical protein n=1 Tax=Kitasatospora sp. NPDC048407 TaxID=3364051 RepID=UPI00371EA641